MKKIIIHLTFHIGKLLFSILESYSFLYWNVLKDSIYN